MKKEYAILDLRILWLTEDLVRTSEGDSNKDEGETDKQNPFMFG